MDFREDDLKIFTTSEADFEALALKIFHFQYGNNKVYHAYVTALGIRAGDIENSSQIPFLPIRFFKSHRVVSSVFDPAVVFESSGTTGSINSLHYVKDLNVYVTSFTVAFKIFYGPVGEWCILGLLPSYLERKGSSLVYMVNDLINRSGHERSGFYLDEHEKLYELLVELEKRKQKTLLIGVSFALLDFAERYHLPLEHTTIMETGGMKGRRQEMIREEVHDRLKKTFGNRSIHSEYGMTELLSQAYSSGEGVFKCPPWMKVLLRDEEDPLRIKEFSGRDSIRGVINIVDLANIYSCSFIATDDAGKLYQDGSFEVIGRIDNSDIRGCSLMVVLK
ncbi:MAG: acyl transferase [Chitinophagaceae bacterium]|nr:acyl transferase [Chitinophagaceae bacterium]